MNHLSRNFPHPTNVSRSLTHRGDCSPCSRKCEPKPIKQRQYVSICYTDMHMGIKSLMKYLGNDSEMRVSKRALLAIGLAGLFILSIAARAILVPFQSGDFLSFLQHWYATIQSGGFAAFSEGFADYNFPYLYLLYIASLLNLSDIVAIKIISIVFDILLAISVWLVVRHYRPSKYIPYVAALTTIWLPTVLLNSSLWGQCDALYASIMVMSFYLAIKKKYATSWVVWGIALSFKLQAIFLLPILVFVWFTSKNSQRVYTPALSIIPILLAPIPAIIAGRPVADAFRVYIDQAGKYEFLTMNLPNWYQWIPNVHYDIFNRAGMIMAVAGLSAMLLLMLARHSKKNFANSSYLLSISLLFLLLAPFLIPQMHERYFFAAGVFSIILAFVNPRYVIPAIILELISLFSYLPFLFDTPPPIDLSLLAIATTGLIIFLIYDIVRSTTKNTHWKP